MKKINAITENLRNWKGIAVALAAVVVFMTTYLLILPAVTLDEETAEAQGGIQVSASEETADVQDPAEQDADVVNAEGADVVEAEVADVIDDGETASEPEKGKAAKETSISDGGKTYDVTVTYGEEAGVPQDASLEVSEITNRSDEDQYDKLMSGTEDALGEEVVVAFARFFDIKIVDGSGEKVEIAAPVDVKIELTDKDGNSEYSENAQVVHFADGAKKGDVVTSTTGDTKKGQMVALHWVKKVKTVQAACTSVIPAAIIS